MAWIVTTRHKPPEDWDFKPSWWHDHYYRVVLSKLHAVQIRRDIERLERNGKPLKAKIKPFKHNPRDEQVSQALHESNSANR